MKLVRFEPEQFGNSKAEQLDALMMLGKVKFKMFCEKHQRIEDRVGTRDLNFPGIDFDLLPMGVKEVPPHILCWIDTDIMKWRAVKKSNIRSIDPLVEVDEDE